MSVRSSQRAAYLYSRFAARVAEKQALYSAAWEQVFRLAAEMDSPDVSS